MKSILRLALALSFAWALAAAPALAAPGVQVEFQDGNGNANPVTLANPLPTVASPINTDNGASGLAIGLTSATGSTQTNTNSVGVVCIINISTITGSSASAVFTIKGRDTTNGIDYTILASASLVATGSVVLKVHPGLTAATNTVANDVLPRSWHIDETAANLATFAATVDCQYVR